MTTRPARLLAVAVGVAALTSACHGDDAHAHARVDADDAIRACRIELQRAANRGPSDPVIRDRFYARRDGHAWLVTGIATLDESRVSWLKNPVTHRYECPLAYDDGDWRLTAPITIDGDPLTY